PGTGQTMIGDRSMIAADARSGTGTQRSPRRMGSVPARTQRAARKGLAARRRLGAVRASAGTAGQVGALVGHFGLGREPVLPVHPFGPSFPFPDFIGAPPDGVLPRLIAAVHRFDPPSWLTQ